MHALLLCAVLICALTPRASAQWMLTRAGELTDVQVIDVATGEQTRLCGTGLAGRVRVLVFDVMGVGGCTGVHWEAGLDVCRQICESGALAYNETELCLQPCPQRAQGEPRRPAAREDRKGLVAVVGIPGEYEAMETLLLKVAKFGRGQAVYETCEVKLNAELLPEVLRSLPAAKNVLREGNVVTFFTFNSFAEGCGEEFSAASVRAMPGVLAAVGVDGGADKLRDVLMGNAGSDNGFGQAF